jgi:hypothetical protein
MSPDGTQSVTVFSFAEGNAATTIEFDGPPNDPVPPDMVIALGQKAGHRDKGLADRLAARHQLS